MAKSMRVVYVHHGQGIAGGAPVSLVNLILGIKRVAEVDIVILCLDDEMQTFFTSMTGASVAILPNPLKNIGKVLIWGISPLAWKTLKIVMREVLLLPISIWQQRKLFRKLKPDFVHLNSSVLFTSAIAARLEGIPIVWHVREVLAGGRFSLRRWFVGWLIRTLAHRVIAISPVEARQLGADRHGKVNVVYNSIDLSRFVPSATAHEEVRRELGFTPNHKVIISLGGVSHWKGTVELIDSMSFTEVNTHLILLGPPFIGNDFHVKRGIRVTLWIEDLLIRLGFQRSRLTQYVERVRMALATAPRERIHFLGNKENVIPFLNASDILVFAGTAPHFPRPVFEAWAMKKPVVIFDIVGIKEHVEDGVDAIVVKEKSGRALGHAVSSLLNDRQQMALIGERGYPKVGDLFDQVKNGEQVFSIYQEMILALSAQHLTA
jgi:glycosyltransferase involved in cell wall biosynthesis